MSVYSRRSGSIPLRVRPTPDTTRRHRQPDTTAPMTNVAARPTPLTPNQIRGFWAAWGGWALDGMDSFIYSLVLVPALTELLPRSGIEATAGNIGFYGSVLFALFLVGWGLSMIWGPIADRFGRVRTLTLTILCYSLFTLLCGVVTGIWQLAALRLLAGIGIGGEWAMGGDVRRGRVARGSPEDRRRLHAHRLLLRLLSRRAGELFHRREVRLALDVRGRRHARRCSSRSSGTACASPRRGRNGAPKPSAAVDDRRRSRRSSRRITRGGRGSIRCTCWCRSSGCGQGRSTCRRR